MVAGKGAREQGDGAERGELGERGKRQGLSCLEVSSPARSMRRARGTCTASARRDVTSTTKGIASRPHFEDGPQGPAYHININKNNNNNDMIL